jgi:hypothetical protein
MVAPVRLALVLVVAGIVVVGCGGDDEPPRSFPPATNQHVYLATAKGCSIDDGGASFSPLKVTGPGGYEVTVKPVEGCREQRIFSSFVYDVPMPATGTVHITPGNQPTATLNAATVTRDRAVTVFYGRVSKGHYRMTVIRPGKDEQVQGAA